MEPTWKKEADKFYCVKKECILRRHPYFWKGMIKIGSDVEHQLKDGHLKLLKEVLLFNSIDPFICRSVAAFVYEIMNSRYSYFKKGCFCDP